MHVVNCYTVVVLFFMLIYCLSAAHIHFFSLQAVLASELIIFVQVVAQCCNLFRWFSGSLSINKWLNICSDGA